MYINMKKSLGLLPAVLFSMILGSNLSAAVCANSASCIFTFDITNGGVTGGNFGTVTLTTSGSNIKVDVNLNAGFHLIQTGSHQAFDFNDSLGGVSLTLGTFSDPQYTQASPPPFHDAFFGDFGHAVNSTAGPGAGTTGVKELTFLVLGHTNVNDIAALSSGGTNSYFAADVFADASVCGSTGFAAGSCTGLFGVTGGGGIISSVPEPTSYLALLMAGLGAIVLLVERRRRTA